jgi:hypothetical protein
VQIPTRGALALSLQSPDLWDEVRILVRAGVLVLKLALVQPTRVRVGNALPIEPEEVHLLTLMGAQYEMCDPHFDFFVFDLMPNTPNRLVSNHEFRWSTARTHLSEVPRTSPALAAASAAADDVFLGLLQTILAIMVPNGVGIELDVQVNEDGDPIVVYTHVAADVFWSRATVSGHSVCTQITLLIAIFAAVQNFPFCPVHPIGSPVLVRATVSQHNTGFMCSPFILYAVYLLRCNSRNMFKNEFETKHRLCDTRLNCSFAQSGWISAVLNESVGYGCGGSCQCFFF